MSLPRRLLLLALAVATIATLAPSVASASLPGNPFADGPFFVDWHWRDENRMVRGDLPLGGLDRVAGDFISRMPVSKWWPLHDPHGSTFDRLSLYLDRAAQEGGLPPSLQGSLATIQSIVGAGRSMRVTLPGAPALAATAPVITALTDETLPKAGCGKGHMGSTADWEAQLKQLVRAIGSHRVVFFVQADSANANACLTGPQKTKRIGLVRREVQMLSALPNTAVYLDAAAADSEPAASTANILRQEGVAMARGFATNLTHYDWTAAEVRYGQKISSLLGGKPFVVNTALNGNGPLVPSNRVRWGNEVWCNPGGRALGPLPQVNPAPHVDAFFWVGNPGHSDGPCGDMPGSMRGPAVGVFWPSWANQLWTSSQHAPDFPTWKRR